MKKWFSHRKNELSDLEFLPSALEVIETPASPIKIQLIYTVCGLFIAALVWSILGKIDVVASANGRIEPTGDVQLIEPVNAGKIAEILVKNGQQVQAGQLLVKMDRRQLLSQRADIQSRLYTWQAEILRREKIDSIAKQVSIDSFNIVTDAYPDWIQIPGLPEAIRNNSEQMMNRALEDLKSSLLQSSAQIAMAKNEESAIQNNIASQEALLETVTKRATIRHDLLREKVISVDAWLEYSTTQKQTKAALDTLRTELAKAQAQKAVAITSFQKTLDASIADNSQKLLDAQRQNTTLSEQLQQLNVQLSQTELTSPCAGIVAASVLTTPGQVVTQGQELMRIVPNNVKMQVRAYVSNADIGFIREGQPAEIKVNTFSFTRYGTLKGTVIMVSHDAISSSESRHAIADGSRQLSSGTSSQESSDMVFPVTISLEKNSMNIDNQSIPLRSGMGVVAEIMTEKRRAINYLLSPIENITSNSMHER
jgi:hemolysin D